MSSVLRHTLLLAGTLIAAAGSGFAGYRLWQWQPQPPPVVNGEVSQDCDLHHGPCEASFPNGGRLRLSLMPRPIPAVATLEIEVQLQNLAAETAQNNLGNLNMNMATTGRHSRRRVIRGSSARRCCRPAPAAA
ncbi:MAG TPA: hypothetical protein VJ396_07955 [Acidiferrobacterales bacterium]|nr:hypothetical protein [Acidiferrobacterales bacterium]